MVQQVDRTVVIKGDVTIWKYLKDLHGPEAIERAIGFHRGRLNSGFLIAVLADSERLEPDDIDLGGSTRWSGGTNVLPSSNGTSIEILLSDRVQDVGKLKEKVCSFLAQGGDNRLAKVLPHLRHNDYM